jgi:hypothetical protein
MRPSLSPLEKGAYGTPESMLSAEVEGPQVSSEGRAATRSAREVEGILIMIYGQFALGNCSKIKKVEGLVGR